MAIMFGLANLEEELASMVVLCRWVVHISLQMGLQSAPRNPCDTFLHTWLDRLLNLSNYAGGTLRLQEMFEPAFMREDFRIQALPPKLLHQTGMLANLISMCQPGVQTLASKV